MGPSGRTDVLAKASPQTIHAASSPALSRTIPDPFTRANLDTRAPLGDLIRDIDPSEIGLFTLVQPQPSAVLDVEPTNVENGRVELLDYLTLSKTRTRAYLPYMGKRAEY